MRRWNKSNWNSIGIRKNWNSGPSLASRKKKTMPRFRSTEKKMTPKLENSTCKSRS